MTENIRNDSMTELLRADFFARNEPNAAWSHTVSDHLLLPALRGFWPMSAHHVTAQSAFVDDIACGFDLGMINAPYLGIRTYTLAPTCGFTAPQSRYLTYGADNVQHDIVGTETIVPANNRGLTLGCWVFFDALGSEEGLIAKMLTAGNQLSYWLYKSAADQIVFSISSLGTPASTVSVTSTATIAAGIWYHIIGRFVPSTALDVYVDSVRTTNAVGVPASLFDSTQPLEMGRIDGGSYITGFLSLAWLCASRCWDNQTGTRDVLPFALYEHSKRLFNK